MRGVLHEYRPGVAQDEVLKTPQLGTNQQTDHRSSAEQESAVPRSTRQLEISKCRTLRESVEVHNIMNE
jgi:hypothetical protein